MYHKKILQATTSSMTSRKKGAHPSGLKKFFVGYFPTIFEAHPISPCQSAHKSLNNLHSCVPCRGIKIAHKASLGALGDSEKVTLLPII